MKQSLANPSPPPAHLSDRAKAVWAQATARPMSPGRLVLLQTALESLDRAEESRLAVAAQGMTSVTERTGAVHVNPLLKVERESRQLFARIWTQLGFHFDIDIDGRAS